MSIQLQQVEQVLAAAGLTDRVLVSQQGPNGNFQVSIKNLGSTTHMDVCGILYKTGEALLKSGLVTNRKAVIQLSHPTGEKDARGGDIWKPWPCAWVNQPDAATQRVAQLEQLIAQQTAMLQQMQGQNPQQAPTVPMNQIPQAVTTVAPQDLTIGDLPGAVVNDGKGTPVF